nr:DUF6192 family protein [Streptomyces sp. FXJ1.172]WEP00079.1 DUF6192 family protein [Streptomyces sp. FXJ1.172]
MGLPGPGTGPSSTGAQGWPAPHQLLAAISDPEERWAAIKNPPLDVRTGKRRWTPETARQRVGATTGRDPDGAGEDRGRARPGR